MEETEMEKAVHNKNKGILLIVTSAFFFALMGIFVKLSGDLPAVEKAFFRNLIAAIIAAIVLIKDKQPIQIGRKKLHAYVRTSDRRHYRNPRQFLRSEPHNGCRRQHAQ